METNRFRRSANPFLNSGPIFSKKVRRPLSKDDRTFFELKNTFKTDSNLNPVQHAVCATYFGFSQNESVRFSREPG
ncbi:hypothetical protein EFP84_04590 [Leptospira kmetyi]|uniref:Uncharacterized protein n=1 Tax=Leptospira kmetyi TaxID=408139 RepID=A0A5F1XKB0_9LEPT|nr:hypothetical protein EFP84_04590 [Leptospira kmetyi]TGK13483.1 hypothetical protein EHO62_17215 [Leptospira kmetyi]TGK31197.1 hypothetical protein EHO66_08700 [Leptospira kmetyi]TGL68576.1 hypothetical protein EHQ67_10895 [Leptospira kmetyi]